MGGVADEARENGRRGRLHQNLFECEKNAVANALFGIENVAAQALDHLAGAAEFLSIHGRRGLITDTGAIGRARGTAGFGEYRVHFR